MAAVVRGHRVDDRGAGASVRDGDGMAVDGALDGPVDGPVNGLVDDIEVLDVPVSLINAMRSAFVLELDDQVTAGHLDRMMAAFAKPRTRIDLR